MEFIRAYNGTRIYTGDVLQIDKRVEGINTFYIDDTSYFYAPKREEHMTPTGLTTHQLLKDAKKIEVHGNLK